MAELQIPDLSLVVLIGASGSGKSTFAARHFRETEVLSSDRLRSWVDDDENSLDATPDAFEALHHLAGLRLKRGRLTVVDATNVRREDRQPLVALARKFHALPVAIVLKVSEEICQQRNDQRPDRQMGRHVVRNHVRLIRKTLSTLKREGFRKIHVLDGPDAIDAATITREPLWCRLHEQDRGPFDIVGDVHGCADELVELLAALGYRTEDGVYRHPQARKLVFVGDLVDRGPRVIETVRIAHDVVAADCGYCVPGNHDMKLLRKLRGKTVQISHGLAESLEQIEALPEAERAAFIEQYLAFVDGLVSHQVLDGGQLVVAHAGMKEAMQGRGSAAVREFALYGETTGETDEFGFHVRVNWAEDYRGRATVVYGHTAVPEAEWLNNTIDIDTGCVFGGKLTALRWPERQLVSVPAKAQYADPIRPLAGDAGPGTAIGDQLLDLEDVTGKRILQTRLAGNVTVRAEHAAAALEVMSRFAADPRWLVYLPPTMSPCETSKLPDYLEHPQEAFTYFRNQGVPRVICEEKHMGSRAVFVVARDEEAATRQFGVDDGSLGECLTRTGRPFYSDRAVRDALLARVREAVACAGLWESLDTDWLALDCELMPWNAKARELLRDQFAPVAVAGRAATSGAVAALDQAVARGLELADLRIALADRQQALEKYATAYGHYCWEVNGLQGVRIAPFHILASRNRVHVNQDHPWHMRELAKLAAADGEFFVATQCREVDVFDDRSMADAVDWWTGHTSTGGEGMVVKPLSFVVRGPKGTVQPAVKCRGREYLRIIYGPHYLEPENLLRLRSRGLGHKRSLAQREFALGIEALERFVRGEPLRRVHECVFGVLAMESEPVDPRL